MPFLKSIFARPLLSDCFTIFQIIWFLSLDYRPVRPELRSEYRFPHLKYFCVWIRGADSGGMGVCIPPQFKVGGGGVVCTIIPPPQVLVTKKKISARNRDILIFVGTFKPTSMSKYLKYQVPVLLVLECENAKKKILSSLAPLAHMYIWRACMQKLLIPLLLLPRKNAYLSLSLYTSLWKIENRIHNNIVLF